MIEVGQNHQQWQQYISHYDLIVEGLSKQGERFPDYYPHPDELRFPEGDFVTGWLGRHPYEGSILRRFYIRVRDVFLLQCEKDRRYFRSHEELDHISGQIALLINALLPNSVQLDEARLHIRLRKQRTLRKPELQRRLAVAWADIGFLDGAKLTTWPLDEAARARFWQPLRD